MTEISDDAYNDIQRIKSHHWRYSVKDKAKIIEDEIYSSVESLTSFPKKKQDFGWKVKNDDGMFIYFYDKDDGSAVVYAIYNETEDWYNLMPGRMESAASI